MYQFWNISIVQCNTWHLLINHHHQHMIFSFPESSACLRTLEILYLTDDESVRIETSSWYSNMPIVYNFNKIFLHETYCNKLINIEKFHVLFVLIYNWGGIITFVYCDKILIWTHWYHDTGFRRDRLYYRKTHM